MSMPHNTGMRKITPFLWFDNNAEEAVNFYTSIFKNSKVINISRYGDEGAKASGKPKGSMMTATFQINGEEFIALNGGPEFKFTPAISFMVKCKTQKEIDELWEKLSDGGRKDQCGWLQDKFGVSWQIVPEILFKLLNDEDPIKSEKVMKAMLQMHKIDIKILKNAYKSQ